MKFKALKCYNKTEPFRVKKTGKRLIEPDNSI